MPHLQIEVNEDSWQLYSVINPEQKQHIRKALEEMLSLISPQQTSSHSPKKSLRQYAAFGSWKDRNIDSIDYQRQLRAEWE